MKYKIKTPAALDVSRWQGQVNWPQIFPRPVLVICKASEGMNFSDSTFAANWSSLKALGIRRGAYHFFRPEMDATKQFANYQKAVTQAGGFQPGDIMPVLDVEGLEAITSNLRQTAPASIKIWLDQAQTFSGKVPMIYTSLYQWSLISGKKSENPPPWTANYPLWVAWFPSKPDNFNAPAASVIPAGWTQWAIWQYAKDGQITGLPLPVDLDILSDWFAQQLDQPTPPSPTPQPPQPPSPTPQPPQPPAPTPQVYQGTVVAPKGVNVRVKPMVSAKLVGALVAGTNVRGDSVKVVSAREAWLEIKDPLKGWCAIVYDGTTLISINPS